MLLSKATYSNSYIHMLMVVAAMQGAGQHFRSSFGDQYLTSTCSSREPRIELAAFRLLDDLLYLLSYSCPILLLLSMLTVMPSRPVLISVLSLSMLMATDTEVSFCRAASSPRLLNSSSPTTLSTLLTDVAALKDSQTSYFVFFLNPCSSCWCYPCWHPCYCCPC